MDKRMVRLEDKVDTIDKRTEKMENKLDSVITSLSCLDDKFVNKIEYKEDFKHIQSILEKLKAFRWQIIAIGSAILWLAELIFKDKFFHF